jgi:hypothetical protein
MHGRTPWSGWLCPDANVRVEMRCTLVMAANGAQAGCYTGNTRGGTAWEGTDNANRHAHAQVDEAAANGWTQCGIVGMARLGFPVEHAVDWNRGRPARGGEILQKNG